MIETAVAVTVETAAMTETVMAATTQMAVADGISEGMLVRK
jgi:hypothetical protein